MTIGAWLEAIQAAVFSSPCPGCGDGGHGGRLCDPCGERLPRLPGASCEVCGEPFVAGVPSLERGPERCAACVDGRAFARARALGPLHGPLHDLVIAVKYRGARSLGRDLGRRAAAEREAELRPIDVVVPVPLARRRRRERGYNQAEVIARGVAQRLGVSMDVGALVRVRETAAQTALSATARRENVRGAFAARGVSGRRVLLVDDVLTTGATLEAAARALRRAGAAEVVVLTLARAVRGGAPAPDSATVGEAKRGGIRAELDRAEREP